MTWDSKHKPTKKELVEWYCVQGKGYKEICGLLGINNFRAIKRWLEEYEIPVKPNSEATIEEMIINGEKTEVKVCLKCGLKLPLNGFRLKKNGLRNRDSRCKKCTKKYHDSRKEEKAAYDLEYRKKDGYVEKRRETSKRFKKTEKGKQSNKIHKHKRRVREKETLSTLTLEEWNKCQLYFSNKCAYCGLSVEELSQDHFVPVSKNGEYTSKNIIPSCVKCNSSKCDRDFFDWYPKQSFYSTKRERKILKYLDIKDNQQQIALF